MFAKQLTINVVILPSGAIVGRSVSDRWNLETLGIKTTSTIANARAVAKLADCLIRVHSASQTVQATPSKAERSALTPSLLGKLTKALKRALSA